MSPQRRDISTWTLFAILFLTALAFIHAYPVFESNKLTFKDGSFKVRLAATELI